MDERFKGTPGSVGNRTWMEYTLTLNGGVPSEVSPDFLQGMIDRMAVSFHKYGPVKESTSDAIASLRKRLDRYEEDGNTEWLMDIGNFAMIEFMKPGHPNAHYRPTDSHESPGRVTKDGRTTHESHRETNARGLSGSMARRVREGT
jgi:hypothetical protein